VPRPEKELKGFSKITLQPGESKVVRLRLSAKEFAFWDTSTHSWRTDPHAYTLLIGGASNRIALEGQVTLQ
jgi:beta-glucosidase